MAEIVNLRLERKRKAREVEAARASENRLKFGAPKAERSLEAARRTRAAKTLEGARREGGDADGER